MELKILKCPECGASFESDNKVSFCSHCGAKLFLDDGTKTVNYNYNYKNEDVAKIKEIEVNKEIQLNKMKENSRFVDQKFLLGVLLFLILVIVSFMFLVYRRKIFIRCCIIFGFLYNTMYIPI